MESAFTGSAGPSPALLEAVRNLLRPLVRLLLGCGMAYPHLLTLLKSLYVEVADTHFRLQAKAQTDSRISLLTGVHRKDVRRLRTLEPQPVLAPRAIALGAQLVARWMGTPGFLDDRGAPVPLARLNRRGGEKSFEALVASLSKDIRPRAVLDEWLRLGIVSLDEHDQVVLRTGAFVPQAGFDERAWYLGRNVHDHLAAAAHNLLGGQPPLLERAVYYDRLSPDAVAQLTALARDAGMEAMQRVNAAALALQERDAGRADAVYRMSFGAYYYDTATDVAAGEATPGKDDAPA